MSSQPRHLLTALVIAVVAFSAACHLAPALVGSRYVKSLRVDPAVGGTLTVSETESPELAGTQLVIEPGALAAETIITLELGLDSIVDGDGRAAGAVAIFGPAGLKFSKPATLTLPYEVAEGEQPMRLFVQVQEGTGERWQVKRPALEVGAVTASFKVDGFTSFQPGTNAQCAADSDCATGQVCQNGACVAADAGQNTGCQTNSDCGLLQICANGTCISNNQQCPTGCPDAGTDAGNNTGTDAGTDGGNNTPDAGTACQSNADCPAGQTCASGTCTQHACDPRLQNCAAGTYCYVQTIGTTTNTICAAPTGSGVAGDTCASATACFGGPPANPTSLWCGGYTATGSAGTCRTHCDVATGAQGCPTFGPTGNPLPPQQCTQIPGAQSGVGYCHDGNTPGCQSHADCGALLLCLNDGTCGSAPTQCNSNAVCPIGTQCLNGVCQ